MSEIFEVDLSQFQREMEDMPRTIMRGARKGIKSFLETVQVDSRQHHRHQRRSGNLERSIEVEVKEDEGRIYLEDGVVEYGKYVHEGHGGPGKSVLNGFPYVWNPDQFIYEAFDKEKENAQRVIEDAINQEISERI